MKILAIETSCDDTCAAVLDNQRVLSNIVSSQIDLHKKWGGVVPDIAKRAHTERIGPVIEEALKRASVELSEIEVVAVTQGPGLAVALGVGIAKAKEIAQLHNKKLVAVNHIEGHLLSNWLKNRLGKPNREITLPALGLTASGGHTKIVLIREIGSYEVVGETLDDAAGEALDKASKLLGLGYPGGPVIERLAQVGDENFIKLPSPLADKKILNYSFSGLKTAFYYRIKDWPKSEVDKNLANLAASFQKAVFDTLVRKFELAIIRYQPKSILASGGVLANQRLRKDLRKMARRNKVKIFMPVKKIYDTDNAAMIGIAGFYKATRNEWADSTVLDRDPRLKL
jgi:N6-L-threonylcarbamoyladenine synthase